MNDRYRKKPVEVQAYQVTADVMERIREKVFSNSYWPMWFNEAVAKDDIFYSANGLHIKTLEGTSYNVGIGYWVVRGVKGEIWPVRDDVFNETYEKVVE